MNDAEDVTLKETDPFDAKPPPSLVRHPETFLTLVETEIDRRSDMVYKRTYPFIGDYINERHRELGMHLSANDSFAHELDRRLLPVEALKAYELAFYCSGDILKLGRFRGLSTTIMTDASSDSGTTSEIVVVDADENTAMTNGAELAREQGGRRAHLLCSDAIAAIKTFTATKRMFACAFVSHGHSFEEVRDACRLLHRVIDVGGFAFFYDFNEPRNGSRSDPSYGVYQGVLDGLMIGRWQFWGIYGSGGLFRHTDPRRSFL